ncbi:MBL fold metallo-hydrolase [Falsiroseomonas tokyonensis]|uniref:MBL fold metallo-hydrolase n=1 Tax=Falsiroseomonas tokyonensis TaxID=430521 RepID=A0ABV7BXJ2_9PROT|nr:MBL fold metallo-hydrolase [Falsiroseomonas tokyonensis]MBU8538900.1 MBL fold metallo-hydrolase [Falsiroseomonas tokyonensis]
MQGYEDRQVAGVLHRRVGDILVTALNDGHQDAPLSTMAGIAEAEAAALLHAAFRPVPRRTAVNGFLVRHGGRVALIDTGCGPIKPTTGRLAGNLASAGIAPGAVDTLLMTHLHPDHFGGLTGPDGAALYPTAQLRLHAAEHAYWHDDAAMGRADPARQAAFFGGARARLAAYADRTDLFTGGEVFPGVTALPLPGHTPGHTGFLIASGGKSLLIWGDIVHVPEVQVARPKATMAVDVDPAQAAETRRRIFDQVATDRQAIAGMHLHFPAFAHLARDGEGFRLVPDAWSLDLDGDI